MFPATPIWERFVSSLFDITDSSVFVHASIQPEFILFTTAVLRALLSLFYPAVPSIYAPFALHDMPNVRSFVQIL